MQSPSPPRILVCGLGRTGQRIFPLLRQQGAPVQGLHSEPPSPVNLKFGWAILAVQRPFSLRGFNI